MLFTIVEDFGIASGDAWTSYLEWRGLFFERFDSLDGVLRKSLFVPESAEDWDHVVCENFMCSYLTDFEYASKARARIGTGSLIGFCYSEHQESDEGFLGYDIIDGYCDVSLLTNWWNDNGLVNRALGSNALVATLTQAENIHAFLKLNHGDDNHVAGCKIISVYSTRHLQAKSGEREVGAGLSVTRSVDEPEGGDKPQPELEGRER